MEQQSPSTRVTNEQAGINMQQQNIDMTHGYLAGAQFDPIEMVFTQLLDQEPGSAGFQLGGPVASTDYDWRMKAFDLGQWGGRREPHLDGQRFPSVEDLLGQFNQDHADRQAERFLALLDAHGDEQEECRREIEESDEWAESVRMRLEALTPEDLLVIQKFSEAVKTGDSDKAGEIVESFPDNAAYFGSLLTAIGLTP